MIWTIRIKYKYNIWKHNFETVLIKIENKKINAYIIYVGKIRTLLAAKKKQNSQKNLLFVHQALDDPLKNDSLLWACSFSLFYWNTVCYNLFRKNVIIKRKKMAISL